LGGIEITGLPLEFIPNLIRGGSDEFGIIRRSFKVEIGLLKDIICAIGLNGWN